MFNADAIDWIKEYMIRNNQTIAVAESVTAGFLQAAFASAEKASSFFQGGLTAYNIDQKVRHLQINREKGEACNCVSYDTANEMAVGICTSFTSDWSISITGYSTPVPESSFRTFAFFSICRHEKIILTDKIELKEKNH